MVENPGTNIKDITGNKFSLMGISICTICSDVHDVNEVNLRTLCSNSCLMYVLFLRLQLILAPLC